MPADTDSAAHSSGGGGHASSGQRQFKKETAGSQLSPVMKRIKEDKDHYIMADNYSSSSRPVSWDKPGPSGGKGLDH